jgi:cell wall-associated NlpC family hydrolase
MVSRLIGAVAGGAVLFLLALIVITGGEVASSTQPPSGGCVITAATRDGTPGPGTPGVKQKSAELTANQMAAARTVVAVGKGLGIAERGIAIALGTAMQESTLKPAATAGRAVGLFQQQGELYSGIDRADPAAAATAFYQQLLARVPTYADPAAGSFADIAQQVQQSGAGPTFYAQWETWATTLAHDLISGPSGTGTAPVVCTVVNGPNHRTIIRSGRDVTLPPEAGIAATITFPNEQAAIAAAAALSYLGTPYAWGGGGPSGPTQGIRGDNAVADEHGDFTKTGFDCSGLTEYAWAQAGIAIGGDSRTQWAAGGNEHLYREVLPGDLLFWGGGYNSIHHVALYLGKVNGQDYMVEAPQSGDVVKVSIVRTGGDFNPSVNRPWDR